MNRSRINLATNPLGNQLLPRLVLIVVGVAALFCTLANLTSYVTNARAAHAFAKKVRTTETEISNLQQERRDLISEIRKQNVSRLAIQVDAANELLQKRDFSWTQLFTRLEHSQPYRVQLERVQPAVRTDSVTLSIAGEAENYDGVLEYIDSLEASPSFSQVYPRSEVDNERKGYKFTLSMVYHPDAIVVEEKEPAPETDPAPGETT